MSEARLPRPTIASVARAAGVSTSTAGRVLGGYGYCSAAVRERVEESARRLGYRPNHLARSLSTGKTRTVGVVAGDIQSPFYAGVLRGIAEVMREAGFGLLLTSSDEEPAREVEAVRLLSEKQVDALIVAPSDLSAATHLHRLAAGGCPVVQIDRLVRGLEADAVVVDNRAAARACTELLLDVGHRDIAILAELETWDGAGLAGFLADAGAGRIDAAALFPSWQRLLGFVEAHLARGLAVTPQRVARSGVYSVDAARSAADRVLATSPRPTALFATDGLMAGAAMAALAGAGLSTPRDVSLVCFDDLDWMAFLPPGITAVVQPVAEIGQAAARMALDRIGGHTGPPARAVLTPRLVRRGSVAAPAPVPLRGRAL